MVLDELPVLLIGIIAGQGSTALAVGAGGVFGHCFSLVFFLPVFFPKQPTNQRLCQFQ